VDDCTVPLIQPSGKLICSGFQSRYGAQDGGIEDVGGQVGTFLEGGTLNGRFFATNLVLSAILLFVLMRFGVLATIADFLYCYLFMRGPITLDSSAWYAPVGYVAFATLSIVMLYTFRNSLAGRPLLAVLHFDD
jgi:hypothetical protein